MFLLETERDRNRSASASGPSTSRRRPPRCSSLAPATAWSVVALVPHEGLLYELNPDCIETPAAELDGVPVYAVDRVLPASASLRSNARGAEPQVMLLRSDDLGPRLCSSRTTREDRGAGVARSWRIRDRRETVWVPMRPHPPHARRDAPRRDDGAGPPCDCVARRLPASHRRRRAERVVARIVKDDRFRGGPGRDDVDAHASWAYSSSSVRRVSSSIAPESVKSMRVRWYAETTSEGGSVAPSRKVPAATPR